MFAVCEPNRWGGGMTREKELMVLQIDVLCVSRAWLHGDSVRGVNNGDVRWHHQTPPTWTSLAKQVVPLLRFPHEAVFPGNFRHILDQQNILGLLHQCQVIFGDDRSRRAQSLLAWQCLVQSSAECWRWWQVCFVFPETWLFIEWCQRGCKFKSV